MTPRYLDAVRDILAHLENTQLPAVEQAADLIVTALTHDGAVFCAEIGHSNQHDFLNRAGGLAAVHGFSFSCAIDDTVADSQRERPRSEPLDAGLERIRCAVRTSHLRPGDVMLIGSVSGKSVYPVELAMACRAMGVKVIGLTSLEYTARVDSLHPSGNKLCDVSDVVVDNGAPYGDAAVEIPGHDVKLLPVSGVSSLVIGWMIWERVIEKMTEAGTPPSVFISLNRPEGKEFYDRSKAEYNRRGY